jgi:hypothetical protein
MFVNCYNKEFIGMVRKSICYTALFVLFMQHVQSQGTNIPLATITHSPYSLAGQLITINKTFEKLSIPATEVEVIDNRYDNSKQGFYPIYKSAPKIITFDQPLSLWLQGQLDQMLQLQPDSSTRKLVLVVQKFWFGNTTVQKFTPFKQNLEVSLYFKVELFSTSKDVYYPLKRIDRNFTKTFNDQDGYRQLIDSFFETLQKELREIDYAAKEKTQQALTHDRVTGYLQNKVDRMMLAKRIKRGVYETFNDFINQKIMGDSVELVTYHDYSGRQTVACHVGVYLKNFLQPCNKCWGYFDGRFLFINVGEGFFIKLTPWYNQFVLADLQQIVYAKKKKPFISEIQISTSAYDVIKDFAKAYHLFFQLDYDDGRIY